MKTHTLGAAKFVEFILTHERNESRMKMIWTALVGEIGQGKFLDRTHQLDNPSDEGSRHMSPRGCLIPVLKGEHDSHIHVA